MELRFSLHCLQCFRLRYRLSRAGLVWPGWTSEVTAVDVKMFLGQPCFTTVFGQNIRRVVLHIGLLELLITLVITTLNVIKYTQYVQLFGEACASKDVCVGPLIKVKSNVRTILPPSVLLSVHGI